MRERKRERQRWDLQSMQAAVDAVRFRHLTPSAASKQYNIPRTTLRCRLQFETVKKGMGRKQDIPPEIEASLKKILSMKEKRNVTSVTAKEREETVAVLTCVSATKVFLPPFVIFKATNLKQEFLDNLPPGSVVFMSDSGYITTELFRKFLGHFVTHKPQGKKTNLLVLDGHSTHVSDPDILQFAVDNNSAMISIPPHNSHYIQPLDSWIKQNPTRSTTKLQFRMLLSQVWGKACSVENGASGFRASGLVPFNPGAIPELAFLPSDCFQMAETETPAERSHCSFQPTNAEPVPGTSGLSDCSVSRQTKRRLSCSPSDSSPEDSC
ncbi:hypothetical protein PR048_027902 [Dryococelus australis]|uniref:DDE-1 domain-containing protein n=1 Tax=Dryococelus australis TaxID=614101 RepID=A0ABQ9GHT0_9NEOP|nr:hypothetical protein PR048_027902 [Dryococelus australis]